MFCKSAVITFDNVGLYVRSGQVPLDFRK
ncbi:cold-shock protein [Salmonella enterica]|nr:cold-shock protein [Salmonella enterica]